MFFPVKEESLSEKDKNEYKIASQNLPEEIYFDCDAIKQNELNSVEMDFILIPFGEDTLVNCNEIIHPNQTFQMWGYIDYDILKETEKSGYLDFTEIPERINFINLYYHNFNNLYIPLEYFRISFYNTNIITSNYLFSYEYRKERFFNLLIGTFGRVSEGWKFYPKFYTYDKNKNFDSFKKER